MGFSLGHQSSDSASYSAPDPMFISAVSAMAKGFPWERFERFFEARPLINASVNDQIFLMRILVLQEMLCLDDKGTIKWIRNQMYLFAFLSPGHKPKIPSPELLLSFREALSNANILEPFRQRCQALIVKHSDTSSFQSPSWSFKVDDISVNSDSDDLAAHWVTCPACQSAKLSNHTPSDESEASVAPWASCDQCGHAFKV
ncbi:hypothetical protein [Leucothrix arctica]|uniref:Uncharacterized protein n=1 Tax=Leucothrix arctica TaxID=1481894 RepID=A0A317CPW4_9GAMM|nr:hypothetical protein [Leucothrix arctica]PWQ98352.1 hypothetical protein DKT75_04280 [Leucothrix arctica]